MFRAQKRLIKLVFVSSVRGPKMVPIICAETVFLLPEKETQKVFNYPVPGSSWLSHFLNIGRLADAFYDQTLFNLLSVRIILVKSKSYID